MAYDETLTKDSSGNTMTSQGTLSAGEHQVANRTMTMPSYSFVSYVSAQTATTVRSGAGVLHAVNVTGGTLGNITIWDNTAGSGTIIWQASTPTGTGSFVLDIAFTVGLTITTAAATGIQLSYIATA